MIPRFGKWFRGHVLAHRGRCFLVLVLAFLAFGGGTVNLFMLFSANLRLVAEHGWMALADGALRQFLELGLTAVASLIAYVIFHACEYQLVRDLVEGGRRDPANGPD